MFRWILLLFLALTLSACDTPENINRPEAPLLAIPEAGQQDIQETPPPTVFEPLKATTLLAEPSKVHQFETTAEALTVWRRAAPQKPILLLLTNNPHLQPVPEELRRKAAILANNANLETLRLASTNRNPSPLLLPGMALDIALRSDWFGEVAWALPLRDPAQELNLEKFREQLVNAGIVDEEENASMTLHERIFSGRLRQTPFRAAALPLIKDLTGPVVVHIDLSYFQPLYKNEIATPLFDILYQTLSTLQKMRLETLAVTFSYGHLDNQIALDVRFLGEVLTDLIETPEHLEEPVPVNWQRQRDALYLANFFQKDKIRELFEAQESDQPDAAYVKFNLYRSAAEHKEGNAALAFLAEAVALDPIYALEYLELSRLAYERERPDEALRMLELAAEAFPEDPFIKLQRAQLAHEIGEHDMALELLNKIRNLQWSTVYYPQVPGYLSEITSIVQKGTAPSEKEPSQPTGKEATTATPSSLSADKKRERILHAH